MNYVQQVPPGERVVSAGLNVVSLGARMIHRKGGTPLNTPEESSKKKKKKKKKKEKKKIIKIIF
jgi:hypothetical protein